jgi:hypothetical protein
MTESIELHQVEEKETSGAFLARIGTDGALWAQEFCNQFGGDGDPGSAIHGWFANAIEAGRSAGYSEGLRYGKDYG